TIPPPVTLRGASTPTDANQRKIRPMADTVLLPNGQVNSLPADAGGALPVGPPLIIGEAPEGTPQGSDPARPTAASVSPQLSFVVPASQAGFAVLSGTVRQSSVATMDHTGEPVERSEVDNIGPAPPLFGFYDNGDALYDGQC